MNMSGQHLWRLGTLVLAIAVCSLAVVWNGQAGAQSVVDRKHSECVGCHRMPEEFISETNPFPPGIDPSSVCLDCHHYVENHHPVNFQPDREDASGSALKSFPLFDGEMRCLTCHEAHGGRGLQGTPKLLRGGPYTARTEICFQCHASDANAKINPHKMLDDAGNVREVNGSSACLLCHTAVPEQKDLAEEITFNADVAFLCWRCHPPMTGQFFDKHFLAKPSQKTLRYMNQVEERDGIKMPLLNRDRITCSTCHNPHQQGVIAYGPADAGADEHDRLRLPRQIICLGCHQK